MKYPLFEQKTKRRKGIISSNISKMKSIVNQQKFKELQEDLYFIHPACSEGYIRANIPALLVHIDPNPG